MRPACFALVLLGGLLTGLLPAGDAPKEDTVPDEQDLVFFHDARPYLFRLHVRIDGRPLHAAWSEFLLALFRSLDVDGNGSLDATELERAPNPRQLLQLLQGAASIEPDAPPEFRDVDGDPADDKVTLAELKDYYRRAGVGPLQVQLAWRVNDTDSLTEALFRHLDSDQDDKLSAPEMTVAALRRLDANDDDVLTVDELGPRAGGAEVLFRTLPNPDPVPESFPLRLLNPGDGPRLAAELLKRYGPDGNGRRAREELAHWPACTPDLELTVRLGETVRGDWFGEVKGGLPVNKSVPGALLVKLPDTQLEVLRRAGGGLKLEGARGQWRARFTAADKDHDGLLDRREIYREPFEFVALQRLADRDGDGKLSEKELNAFLDLQEKGLAAFTLLTLADRGRPLFELLDADHDGRLGPRELQAAWTRLSAWDRDGDGLVARSEVPRQFQLTLSHGQQAPVEQGGPLPGYGPASRPRYPAQGPLWFQKMDLNRDGDLSRREFLGTDEEFRRLDADGDGFITLEEAEQADARLRKTKTTPPYP
jgi:Ca2+-binding EF-hand superfamily protein